MSNLEQLLADCQRVFADSLNIVEFAIDAAVDGDHTIRDKAEVVAFRRRLNDTHPYPLGACITFQVQLLAVAAVRIAELSGQAPGEVVARWRRQAARMLNLAEARLSGEPTS